METETLIETKILKGQLLFFIYTVFYFLCGIGIAMYLLIIAPSIFFSILTIILTFLIPTMFQNTFRNLFLKKASVSLRRYSLSVTLDEVYDEENNLINFENIKFFSAFASEKNDFSTLKLQLRNGNKLKYIFTGQENLSTSKTDINNRFKKLVLEYNESKSSDERIKLAPTFWATRSALYLQQVAGLFILAFAAYYAYRVPMTLFVSIAFLPLYYSVTLVRKKAKKEQKQFS